MANSKKDQEDVTMTFHLSGDIHVEVPYDMVEYIYEHDPPGDIEEGIKACSNSKWANDWVTSMLGQNWQENSALQPAADQMKKNICTRLVKALVE